MLIQVFFHELYCSQPWAYLPSRLGQCFLHLCTDRCVDVLIQGCVARDPTRYRSNTLRPRQNGRHFPDDIFKCIFLNENVWISIKISLKIVPKGPINNIPALVQIMAWRWPSSKPLSELMMVSLLTHICITQLQWVNSVYTGRYMKIFENQILNDYICQHFL